jgi:hypothetical protein
MESDLRALCRQRILFSIQLVAFASVGQFFESCHKALVFGLSENPE